ncbi:hypothetical protein D5086_000204 [Populus alba]|uniref:Uncharacterized protein n=1 Tax=Populus alba TaxID=43335 RepID=A0ACC4CVY0_POPAL
MRNNMSVCFTFSRKLLATEKGSFEVERNLFGPFNLGGAGRSCGFSVGASEGFCGGARASSGEIVGVEADLGIQWIMPLTDWAWISIIKLPIVGWKMECIGKMLHGFGRLVGFDKTSVQSPALFALRILVGTKNVVQVAICRGESMEVLRKIWDCSANQATAAINKRKIRRKIKKTN